MKILKFVKLAASTAVLAAASLGANAALTQLGAVSITTPTPFGGLVAGNSVSFNDVFGFSLPVNGGSGYSVTNFVPGISFGYNTIFASATLFSNLDGSLGFNGDEQLITNSVASGNAISFAVTSKPTGSYFLVVNGITAGSAGGIYNGAIQVSAVSPVPEPETYAILLAGLGLMGAIARRRNKA